jgi:hypothetical protein
MNNNGVPAKALALGGEQMTSTVPAWRKASVRLGRAALLGGKGALQRLRRRTGLQGSRRMIFVAGVQRSGTNMLMDVFEKSLQTDVFHERDRRAFDNYLMRPTSIIRQLYDQSPAPFFVIKALCELQRLESLLKEFAPSKAIWVVRDFEDVVN